LVGINTLRYLSKHTGVELRQRSPSISPFERRHDERGVIRVEPISSWLLTKQNAPASPVTRGGGMGVGLDLPPFDPDTGELYAGSSDRPNSCSSIETVPADRRHIAAQRNEVQRLPAPRRRFAAGNAIYARDFPEIPRRIFVCVP
jgi:2-iminobutanoate/2-iminopropanoate deaminase